MSAWYPGEDALPVVPQPWLPTEIAAPATRAPRSRAAGVVRGSGWNTSIHLPRWVWLVAFLAVGAWCWKGILLWVMLWFEFAGSCCCCW